MAHKRKSYDSVLVSDNDVTTQRFFSEIGFNIATSPEDSFDMCVFSGGSADVHPFLYGQRKIDKTHVDPSRDLKEVKLWRSLPNDMPKIGICRGAQLGNVMCGGTLWQDVDNHNHGTHAVLVKPSPGKEEYHTIMTLHHQMCRPTEDAEVLVWASAASKYEDDSEVREIPRKAWTDIEAFFYPYQNFLGIQWHPEYNHKASTELFNELFYVHCFNK